VFLEETTPKLENEAFVLFYDYWINLAYTQKTTNNANCEQTNTILLIGLMVIRYLSTKIHVNSLAPEIWYCPPLDPQVLRNPPTNSHPSNLIQSPGISTRNDPELYWSGLALLPSRLIWQTPPSFGRASFLVVLFLSLLPFRLSTFVLELVSSISTDLEHLCSTHLQLLLRFC
jgi:hypothetical protein